MNAARTDDRPRPAGGKTRRIAVALYFRASFGGGERYLLTAASALRRLGQVEFLSPHPTDLAAFSERFAIDLDGVRFVRRPTARLWRDYRPWDPPYDLFLALDNHLEPIQPSLGRRGILQLQSPPYPPDAHRPIRSWIRMRSYDVVVCYSEYTRGFALRHGTAGREIRVIYPPVDVDLYVPREKRRTILSVGRFFVGRHEKKHPLLIETFRRLLEAGLEGYELCLAGSLRDFEPAHVAYLESLREQARGLPVRFVVNGSLEEMRGAFGEASFYWHGAGYGVDEQRKPQHLEHFGISIVEAMAAGAIPLAHAKGGPLEIVRAGVDGHLWSDPEELVERTLELVRTPEGRLAAMRASAREAARRFSRERFESEILGLAERLLERP